jgi:prepilin-type N-terminal cleavage/methylation domain-containing protein
MREHKSSGFSLIEVLVATLIASTVVLGFAGGTLAVMRLNRVSAIQSRAAAFAQARLAQLVGDFTAALEADPPAPAPAPGTATDGPFTLTWTYPAAGSTTTVRVVVTWSAPQPGSVTLETILNT